MKSSSPHPQGFSLVEVTLALGVAAFCLIPLMGLLPVGINSNNTSLEQTAAANLATRIVADLQATPASGTASPNYAVPVPTGDLTLYVREDGTVGTVADGRYRARVITGAGTGGAHAATVVRMLITWPAATDPAKGAAQRFETVVNLNRN